MQLSFVDALPASRSVVQALPSDIGGYATDFDFLTSRVRHRANASSPALHIVDLFCGAGGLSIGAELAALSHRRRLQIAFSVEIDPLYASVYSANFGSVVHCSNIADLFADYGTPNAMKKLFEAHAETKKVDILLAGPPCQGHSDLNNYSRRSDIRNDLYFSVARAAEVLRPRHIVIENVPGVKHSQEGVVAKTTNALKECGYSVQLLTADAADFGVAQHRKRFFLVASLDSLVELPNLIALQMIRPRRTVEWAIHDLEYLPSVTSILDVPGATNADNQRRIDYLFDNGQFDLPNEERPACHSTKKHSYKSVYGRLRADKPAQTITRGFYSVCMGRYIHPSQRRSITAHEAARLQFMPDWFSYGGISSRSKLAKLIGNLVPPKLSFVILNALLTIEGPA